eukprot:486696-Pelagomonas_calceolata.AAC.3
MRKQLKAWSAAYRRVDQECSTAQKALGISWPACACVGRWHVQYPFISLGTAVSVCIAPVQLARAVFYFLFLHGRPAATPCTLRGAAAQKVMKSGCTPHCCPAEKTSKQNTSLSHLKNAAVLLEQLHNFNLCILLHSVPSHREGVFKHPILPTVEAPQAP